MRFSFEMSEHQFEQSFKFLQEKQYIVKKYARPVYTVCCGRLYEFFSLEIRSLANADTPQVLILYVDDGWAIDLVHVYLWILSVAQASLYLN